MASPPTRELSVRLWLSRALTRLSALRVEASFYPGGADHRVQRLVDSSAGCDIEGRNEPSRSLGMASSSCPVGVERTFSRVPLRRVVL